MIIHVNVKTGAREEAIDKIGEHAYSVFVREQPQKGKANASLIRLLAKEFGVSQSKVIVKTPTSRKKIVEIKT